MPEATLRIVSLSPTRWKEFKALRIRALKQEPLAFGANEDEAAALSDAQWENPLKESREGKKQRILFAEHNGVLVGMIGVYFEPLAKLQHVGIINQVYVEPKFRGQGIAKLLLQSIIAFALARPGTKKLKLTVQAGQVAAIGLYERLGFKVVGTLQKELCVKNKYYDELLMELQF